MHNPLAKISLSNIKHNIEQIKSKLAKSVKVMPVIKANAYGHGAVAIAEYLESNKLADAFAVARYQEASLLRNNNIRTPILILDGIGDSKQLQAARVNNYWVAIENQYQLNLLNHLDNQSDKQTNPINIWLKFNTGMNRSGFDDLDNLEQLLNNIYQLTKNKIISKDIVVLSHFACADNLENNYTEHQVKKFEYLINLLEKINKHQNYNLKLQYSLANSAGIFGWANSHYDWVRPGISLYGASPINNKPASEFNLKPVMILETYIIDIKKIHKGDKVGYSSSWVAENDTYIATVAFGYADGYPWLNTPYVTNNNYIFCNNKKYKIIGRISMDTLAFEFKNEQELNINDKVELWGENILVDDVANSCNTISYELLSKITARVEKTYYE